jgi:hypothetical protein
MEMLYKQNAEGVDWERVAALFELAGWGARMPDEVCAAFQSSSYVRSTWYWGIAVVDCLARKTKPGIALEAFGFQRFPTTSFQRKQDRTRNEIHSPTCSIGGRTACAIP